MPPPDPAAESLRLLRAERDQLEAECGGLMRDIDELMRDRIGLAARVEDLRGQRDQLEAVLEDLKVLEAEYRAGLIGYLDALAGTLRMEARL